MRLKLFIGMGHEGIVAIRGRGWNYIKIVLGGLHS